MTRNESPAGVVVAVCTVERVVPGHHHDTAIDKRPRSGRVRVGELGLEADRQMDPGHGGPDAAVYVYAEEDARSWAESLGREVDPGLFGENVRTSGLDVTGALIGERWRIGEVLLEVRKPRTPCGNLSLRVGAPGFHLDFARSGRVGAMCAVLTAGTIGSEDEATAESRPAHPVTVGDYVAGLDAAAAQRLLDAGLLLARPVRAKALRTVRRGRA